MKQEDEEMMKQSGLGSQGQTRVQKLKNMSDFSQSEEQETPAPARWHKTYFQ